MISAKRNKIGAKDTRNIIIIFFYLFFFRLQGVRGLSFIESTTFIGVVLILIMVVPGKYSKTFSRELLNRKSSKPLIWCIAIIAFSVIIVLVHGTGEFSILKPLIHQLIFIFVGIEVYAFFKSNGSEDKVFEYIIIAYSIQTIIQYLSFLIPAFNSFTDLFKTEEAIRMKTWYSGFRGNAISGSIAGSLACGYSIVTIILLIKWADVCFFRVWTKYLALLLLILGGIAAGRISIVLDIVGIFIIGICKLIKIRTHTIRISKNTLWLILLSPAILIIIYFGARSIYSNASADFLSRLSTVSGWLTNALNHYLLHNDNNFWEYSYSAVYEIKNILFGDGLFTNPDGSYYLRVDAGYIRMIGFGGVVWIFTMLIYQTRFFKFQKEKIIGYAIMGMLLVATSKQDSIGISLQNQLILILLYLDSVHKLEENYEQRIS